MCVCVERKELEIIRVQKAGSRTFFYLQQYVRITPYCFIASYWRISFLETRATNNAMYTNN